MTNFDHPGEQDSTDGGDQGGETISGSVVSSKRIVIGSFGVRQDFDSNVQEGALRMFLFLFFLLLVAWIMGFTVFHVAGGLIHLLLIVAVISLVVHFLRGRTAV